MYVSRTCSGERFAVRVNDAIAALVEVQEEIYQLPVSAPDPYVDLADDKMSPIHTAG